MLRLFGRSWAGGLRRNGDDSHLTVRKGLTTSYANNTSSPINVLIFTEPERSEGIDGLPCGWYRHLEFGSPLPPHYYDIGTCVCLHHNFTLPYHHNFLGAFVSLYPTRLTITLGSSPYDRPISAPVHKNHHSKSRDQTKQKHHTNTNYKNRNQPHRTNRTPPQSSTIVKFAPDYTYQQVAEATQKQW